MGGQILMPPRGGLVPTSLTALGPRFPCDVGAAALKG